MKCTFAHVFHIYFILFSHFWSHLFHIYFIFDQNLRFWAYGSLMSSTIHVLTHIALFIFCSSTSLDSWTFWVTDWSCVFCTCHAHSYHCWSLCSSACDPCARWRSHKFGPLWSIVCQILIRPEKRGRGG